jgi:hypothetical protein
MDSGSVLRAALVVMRKALKGRGFSAKGPTFHRRVADGNVIGLAVQRSVKSTAAEAEVTLNYGVYSARIGSRLQEDPSSALDLGSAHWQRRLRENGREKWLHVKSVDSPDEVARMLLNAVETLLPDLLDHSTDEALRSDWLSGSAPGLTAMQRLLFGAILVNEIGPADRLRDTVEELRRLVAGSVHQGLVEGQLERAGVRLA